ncbi:MAG: hypothetical protein ABSB01_17845 [Streptosporangiaceae bacterium]
MASEPTAWRAVRRRGAPGPDPHGPRRAAVREPACAAGADPDIAAGLTIDLDATITIAHSEKENAAAENLIRGSGPHSCSPGTLPGCSPVICLRFVFLLITR